MIVAIFLLTVYSVVCTWIIYVQVSKVNKLSKILDIALTNLESVSGIIHTVSSKLDNPKLKIAFESDDEVGFFFNQIRDIQEMLDNFDLEKNNAQKE